MHLKAWYVFPDGVGLMHIEYRTCLISTRQGVNTHLLRYNVELLRTTFIIASH